MDNITGKRIKELRLAKGLSQEELAKMVGVKNAAIHKYENGIVVNLKRTTIELLAEALDTTELYLLGYDLEMLGNSQNSKTAEQLMQKATNAKNNTGTPYDAPVPDDIKDILELLFKLSPAGRETALTVLKGLVAQEKS